MEKAGGQAAAFTHAVRLSARAGVMEQLDTVERRHPAEQGLKLGLDVPRCIKPGHSGTEAAGRLETGLDVPLDGSMHGPGQPLAKGGVAEARGVQQDSRKNTQR